MNNAKRALDAALANLERARPIFQGLQESLSRWEEVVSRQGLDVSTTRRRWKRNVASTTISRTDDG